MIIGLAGGAAAGGLQLEGGAGCGLDDPAAPGSSAAVVATARQVRDQDIDLTGPAPALRRGRAPGAVPCRLDFTDLDAPVISAFLDHIERERGNTIRSRNARLAAIHSLFSFAALRHLSTPPTSNVSCDPSQAGRPDDRHVPHRHRDRSPAHRPGPVNPTGRRDHAWMLLAVQTGLRASELTTLTCRDVHLGGGAYVACHGTGRKTGSRRLARALSPPCGPGSPSTPGAPRPPLVHHHPRRAHEPGRPPAAAHRYATAAVNAAPPWSAKTSPRTSCAFSGDDL